MRRGRGDGVKSKYAQGSGSLIGCGIARLGAVGYLYPINLFQLEILSRPSSHDLLLVLGFGHPEHSAAVQE
jgi:Ni,Fe-hydrogenase III small subunit